MSKNYFDAYQATLQHVRSVLTKYADEFKSLGFDVYLPDPELRWKYIVILKDEKHVFFGFAEVPYRYYLSISWKPNRKTGAGKTVKNAGYSRDDTDPFEYTEVVEAMAPNHKDLLTRLETYVKY